MESQWKEPVQKIINSMEKDISETRDMLNNPPRGKAASEDAKRAQEELENEERLLTTLKTAISSGDMWHALFIMYTLGKCETAGFYEAMGGLRAAAARTNSEKRDPYTISREDLEKIGREAAATKQKLQAGGYTARQAMRKVNDKHLPELAKLKDLPLITYRDTLARELRKLINC